MIVDGLIVLGTSRFGTALTPEDSLNACDHAGIDHAIATIGHPIDHDFIRGNLDLAEMVARSQDRLVGLCRIDPWDGQRGVDLSREMVTVHGFRGLYLHPGEEHFRINDHRLKAVADLLGELSVPVVIATGYPWFSEPTQVAEFATWCPTVPVIMTNGGQFNISGLSQIDAEAALALNHVYLHTTGVYREDFLQKVVATFGADRLLFASSSPHFDQRYEVMRAQLLHISDEERAAVLGENAARLFSIYGGETE